MTAYLLPIGIVYAAITVLHAAYCAGQWRGYQASQVQPDDIS